VISISAGNHAQALAYAAAVEGISAHVVMWATASPLKIGATREYGATVDTEAADPGGAFDRLEDLIAETGRTLVHPFDDPLVQAGQGTVGLELCEDVPHVDTVLVPVGGGGLISGVATAVKGRRPQARVIAVEPERSPALHEALKAGRQVRVDPTSVADGLGAPFAGENALTVCRELVDESVLVTEDAIEAAFRFLYARAKLACEPAGAAATAALLSGAIGVSARETVVVIVSGGNVGPEQAAAILSRP
jgi:threonine dehydratase